MRWTRQKPKVPGLYWWQKRKKSRMFLIKVELWERIYDPCLMAIIVDTCSGEDDLDEVFPFVGWDKPKDFGGYWSDSQITRPSGY